MEDSGISEVERLLYKIGSDLNKPPEQIEPLVKRVVKDNWLDTIDSLRGLSESQWLALNLPMRVVEELQSSIRCKENDTPKKCGRLPPFVLSYAAKEGCNDPNNPIIPPSGLSSVSNWSTHTQLGSYVGDDPLESWILASGAKDACGGESGGVKWEDSSRALDQVSTVSACASSTAQSCSDLCKPDESDEATYQLTETISRLTAEVPEKTLKETLIPTLLGFLKSILENPDDEKKRKIKVSNETFQSLVGRFAAAVAFMRAIGFKDDAEFWTLAPANLLKLAEAHKALSEVARKLELSLPFAHQFDPFKASITQIASRPSPKLPNETDPRNMREAISNRLNLLKHGEEKAEIPLNVKVFHANDINKLEEAKSSMNTVKDADLVCTANEALSHRENLTDIPCFELRAKKELNALCKRKVFSQCTLRVKFPNKLILELTFKPSATVAHFQNQLASCLRPETREKKWTVFMTPPKRFLDPAKTLYEENLVPGALLHFKMEGEGETCYLVDELLMGVLSPSITESQVKSSL